MEALGSTPPPIRPPEPQSPSAGSESGKSDTSSAKRKWKAMIASLPPLLPTQQQVMQQLLETDSRELRKQRVIDPDAVYVKSRIDNTRSRFTGLQTRFHRCSTPPFKFSDATSYQRFSFLSLAFSPFGVGC